MRLVLLEDNVMVSMPLVDMAQSLGMEVVVASTMAEVQAGLANPDLTHVLLSMRLVMPHQLPQWPAGIKVAAYGPHVEGEQFLAFRRLGIRDVWPNSKLREKLPRWLMA